MMWYWGSGVHWWGWLLGLLAMVLFWGFVAWGVWYLVTSLFEHRDRRPPSAPLEESGAKRILDERLARGEIDAEEYRRLRDLMNEAAERPRDKEASGTTRRG